MTRYKLKKVKDVNIYDESCSFLESTGLIQNPSAILDIQQINIKYAGKMRDVLLKIKQLQSKLILLQQQRQAEIQKANAKVNGKMKSDLKQNSTIPTTSTLLRR